MIKELFATCLLSASVGTSGLNMQTRENENIQTFESYLGYEDQLTYDINTIANTTKSPFKAWLNQAHKNVNGNIVSAKLTRKSAILAMTAQLNNRDAMSTDWGNYYDVYMIEVSTYASIISSEFDIWLKGQFELVDTTKIGYRQKVIITTNEEFKNEFNRVNISNTNYDANTGYSIINPLKDFVDKIETGQLGYQYDVLREITTNDMFGLSSITNPYLQNNKTNYIFVINELAENTEYYIDLTTSYHNIPYSVTFLEEDEGCYITGNYKVITPTEEIIDIPGLMFTVLTMPFTFISQAFNVTLFPGTPYQVNISALIIAIISAIILAWILGLIIKGLK